MSHMSTSEAETARIPLGTSSKKIIDIITRRKLNRHKAKYKKKNRCLLSLFVPYGRQPLHGPQWSPTPGIWPFCNTLYLSVDGTCDLFLINRIWQWWWNVTSIIKMHKIVTFILLADSFYSLFGLHALMKQAAMFEKPMFEKQRTEHSIEIGTSGLQSNSSQNTGFCCVGHTPPHELGSASFPSWAFRCYSS